MEIASGIIAIILAILSTAAEVHDAKSLESAVKDQRAITVPLGEIVEP